MSAARIQQIYIALFNRPADPLGLDFWLGQTNQGTNLTPMLAALAPTAEYQDRFSGLSTTQQVNSIYQALFGRDADLAGLTFFSNQLQTGALTLTTLAVNILDGAQGTDATIITNKVTAATNFTAALDTGAEVLAYTGAGGVTAGTTYLSGITSDAATVPDATATAAAITTLTQSSSGGAPGQTLTLTTGTDLAGVSSASTSGITSEFRFTSKNETVNAGVGTLGAADALLDGSTTDADVMNVTLTGASGAFTTQNIETIKATFAAGTPVLELDNVLSTKTVEVSGSVAGTVDGFNAQTTTPTIALNGYTNTVTIAPTTGAGTTAGGTPETLNVSVSGSTFGTTAATQTAIIYDPVANGALETLNLVSAGTAANDFSLADSAGSVISETKLTGSVDAQVRMTHADITGATFNATGHTGASTLLIDRNGATTTPTSLSGVTGVNNIAFRDSTAGGDQITASGIADASTIWAFSDFTNGTLTVTGAAGKSDNTLTLNLDNLTASTDTDLGTITIQDVETLNIGSQGLATATATTGNSLALTAGDFTSIKVTGDTSLDITSLNVDAPTSGTRATTVDASGMTGDAVFFVDASADTDSSNTYTVTGSAKNDELITGAGADTVNGGAGNDVVTAGGGNDTIDLGAGNDEVNIEAGAGVDTVTLGAGTDIVDFNSALVTQVAQVNTITLANTWAAGDTITVTLNGNAQTYTATGLLATVDDGLINFLNNAFGSTITAAQGAGTTVTVTADTAGTPFTLAVAATTLGDGTGTQAATTANAAGYTTKLSDFTSADDTLDIAGLGLTSDGGYYQGAAGDFVAATEYQVIVLTGTGYADADAAETAIAARYAGGENDSQVFVYFDTTAGIAKMVYDADIDGEATDLDAAIMAEFSNITTVGTMADAFNEADFTLA